MPLINNVITIKFYSLFSLTSAIAIFITLIIAFKRLDKNRNINLLCFFLSQLFLYMIFEFFFINGKTKEAALFFDRLMYIPIITIPCIYLHLILIFPKPYKMIEQNKFLEPFIYLPAVIFITLLSTPYMLSDMEKTFWGWGKVTGSAFNFFRIFFTLYLGSAIFLFIHKFIAFKEKDEFKNALLCMFLYTSPVIILGIIIITILPFFKIQALNIIATSLMIAYLSIALSYTILGKNLFDFLAIFNQEKAKFPKKLVKTTNSLPLIKTSTELSDMLSYPFGADVALFLEGNLTLCKAKTQEFCNIQIYEQDIQELIVNTKSLEPKLIIDADHVIRQKDSIKNPVIKKAVKYIVPFYEGSYIRGAILLGDDFRHALYSGKDKFLSSLR